jgi:hypothetical protein
MTALANAWNEICPTYLLTDPNTIEETNTLGALVIPLPIPRSVLQESKGGTYLGLDLEDPIVSPKFQEFTNTSLGYDPTDNIAVIGQLVTDDGIYVIVGKVDLFPPLGADSSPYYATTENKIFLYDPETGVLTFIRDLYPDPTTQILLPKNVGNNNPVGGSPSSSGSPGSPVGSNDGRNDSIAFYYNPITMEYELAIRNNSNGSSTIFSNSYTIITLDRSGNIIQTEKPTAPNAFPPAVRFPVNIPILIPTIPAGANGLTYPLNLATNIPNSGTILQARIELIPGGGGFEVKFGNTVVISGLFTDSPVAPIIRLVGYTDPVTGKNYIEYYASTPTQTYYGWIVTDNGSTTIIDQAHFSSIPIPTIPAGANGLTYPLNLATNIPNSGTIQQARIELIPGGGGFNVYFGNTLVVTGLFPGSTVTPIIRLVGYTDPVTGQNFIQYYSSTPTQTYYGWIVTDNGSTTIIDQAHFSAPTNSITESTISNGLTYPLNFPPFLPSYSGVLQTRVIQDPVTGIFTVYFGSTVIATGTLPPGADLSIKGFYDPFTDTHFVTYVVSSPTQTYFGWIITDGGSTTILDSANFVQPLPLVDGSGFQHDGKFFAHFTSNLYGDIFLTADGLTRGSSQGLLWLMPGQQTFVELPVPFGVFPTNPTSWITSTNVTVHPLDRTVYVWYWAGDPNGTNHGYSVIFAQYDITPPTGGGSTPPYSDPSPSCTLSYGEVTQPLPITRTALEAQKGGTYLGTATSDPTVYSRFQRFNNTDFGYLATDRINVLGTLPTPSGMYVVVGSISGVNGTTVNHKIYLYDEDGCGLSFVRNLYPSSFQILRRKNNLSPAVENIGDFYDSLTDTYVLALRNSSTGSGSVFSNSYTRLSVDSSGTLTQTEVGTIGDAFPASLRAPDGTLQTALGFTFPLPLVNTTPASGTIQQTRIVSSGATFTVFFGTTALRSETGNGVGVKGFYNRHNNTAFIMYSAVVGTTAKFGWLTTDAASTNLLDQQDFTKTIPYSGDGYQFDGRLYSQFGSNSFGDIFMTADHDTIPSSRGLLWMQEGKRTFVELPLPFGAFEVAPSTQLTSCNIHNHATERKVSTWYSDNLANSSGDGTSVVLAEYTIKPNTTSPGGSGGGSGGSGSTGGGNGTIIIPTNCTAYNSSNDLALPTGYANISTGAILVTGNKWYSCTSPSIGNVTNFFRSTAVAADAVTSVAEVLGFIERSDGLWFVIARGDTANSPIGGARVMASLYNPSTKTFSLPPASAMVTTGFSTGLVSGSGDVARYIFGQSGNYELWFTTNNTTLSCCVVVGNTLHSSVYQSPTSSQTGIPFTYNRTLNSYISGRRPFNDDNGVYATNLPLGGLSGNVFRAYPNKGNNERNAHYLNDILPLAGGFGLGSLSASTPIGGAGTTSQVSLYVGGITLWTDNIGSRYEALAINDVREEVSGEVWRYIPLPRSGKMLTTYTFIRSSSPIGTAIVGSGSRYGYAIQNIDSFQVTGFANVIENYDAIVTLPSAELTRHQAGQIRSADDNPAGDIVARNENKQIVAKRSGNSGWSLLDIPNVPNGAVRYSTTRNAWIFFSVGGNSITEREVKTTV